MICPKCKKIIPDSSVQCPECNENITSIKKKAKTKRIWASILSILIIIFALVAIIDFIDSDDTSNSGTASSDAQSLQESENSAEPIYEDDYIKASFINVYDDETVDTYVEGISYMQLLIENKSDKNFTVGFENAAINGMSTTIGSGLPVTVLPGNSSKQPFILFTKNAGISSANDINKIQFSFHLMDENVNTIDKTETITINIK